MYLGEKSLFSVATQYIHVAFLLADAVDDRDSIAALLGSHVFKGVTVEVKRGDYAPIMATVVEHLTRAKVSCHLVMLCCGAVLL